MLADEPEESGSQSSLGGGGPQISGSHQHPQREPSARRVIVSDKESVGGASK